jgi:hypothetical protein
MQLLKSGYGAALGFFAGVGVLSAMQVFGPPFAAGRAEGAAGKIPDVLRARMLELVDESGQVRANLKVEPGGEVVFRLRDAQGTVRVKLAASADGSGLLLLDDRTEPGAHLLASPRGTSLTLSARGKEKRVIEP